MPVVVARASHLCSLGSPFFEGTKPRMLCTGQCWLVELLYLHPKSRMEGAEDISKIGAGGRVNRVEAR
jgi:hypothetical protein